MRGGRGGGELYFRASGSKQKAGLSRKCDMVHWGKEGGGKLKAGRFSNWRRITKLLDLKKKEKKRGKKQKKREEKNKKGKKRKKIKNESNNKKGRKKKKGEGVLDGYVLLY